MSPQPPGTAVVAPTPRGSHADSHDDSTENRCAGTGRSPPTGGTPSRMNRRDPTTMPSTISNQASPGPAVRDRHRRIVASPAATVVVSRLPR